MEVVRETTTAEIKAALERHAARVTPHGPDSWDLGLSAGPLRRGTARTRAGWLILEFAPPPAADPAEPWPLLRANAHAGSGVKFALDAAGRAIRVLAEAPLDSDEPADIDQVVGVLLAGAIDASSALAGEREAAAGGSGTVAQAPAAPVASLCDEAGWPHTPRSGGRIAVTLEAQRRPVQAVLEPTADGGVIASAELTNRAAPPAEANRRALGVMLLAGSGCVRLVRAAAVEPRGGGVETRFEAVLPRACGARHLHHALAALSVACGLCGPEAELLHDDAALAEAYLLAWGGPRAHVRTNATA